MGFGIEPRMGGEKEDTMALQAIHDKIDDIPEPYRDLYTEKAGKFELTGISGIKTQADFDRLNGALTKERSDHGAARQALEPWTGLGIELTDLQTTLDRVPELEAAAAGKLDDAAIDDIVNRRVDGTLKSREAPLQRSIADLTKSNETLLAENTGFKAQNTKRAIHDNVRAQLVEQKVIPEAHEDALFLAERVFEVREDDGMIVTRDGVGVTPGVEAGIWLTDMQEKRPHWWPPSQGGGAQGGGRGPSGAHAGAANPWSAEGWNMTKQMEVAKTKGRDYAVQLAVAAGTTLTGGKPKPK